MVDHGHHGRGHIAGQCGWRSSSPSRTRANVCGANGRPLGWNCSARDIVSTIQAEQDEIIWLDHPEVLVIDGGPGDREDRGGNALRLLLGGLRPDRD
jgi:hypothetical protein